MSFACLFVCLPVCLLAGIYRNGYKYLASGILPNSFRYIVLENQGREGEKGYLSSFGSPLLGTHFLYVHFSEKTYW